jgi:hypothetical protein
MPGVRVEHNGENEMTNKILDHIETVILTGQDRVSPHGLDFCLKYDVTDPKDDRLTISRHHRVRASLTVYFEQYIDATALPEVRRVARERAKSAIARHIYGDVLENLLTLREMLWEDGVRDGEHTKKLNTMISDLSGEMQRFEI